MVAQNLHNLGFEFGDQIIVSGNGFTNTPGVFIAFQDDFLLWVAVVAGAPRLLATNTNNLTIS